MVHVSYICQMNTGECTDWILKSHSIKKKHTNVEFCGVVLAWVPGKENKDLSVKTKTKIIDL